MTTSPTDNFKAVVNKLNTSELAGAYKALYESNAPMQCLEVILNRIVDEQGQEFAEGLVDTLA